MGKWNKAPPQISQQFLQNEERRKQMIIEAAKRRKQKQRKLQQQVEQQKKQEQQALTRHKQQKKDAYVKYLRNNLHDKYEEIKMRQKQSQVQPRSKSKWKKDTLDGGSQIKSEKNLQGLDLEVNMDRRRKNVGGVGNNNRVSNKPGGQVVRNQPMKRNINNNNRQEKQPIWQKETPVVSENHKNNSNNNNSNRNTFKQQQFQKRRMLQDEFQNMWKQQHQEQQQKQIDYQLSVQQTVFEDMMGSKLLDSLDLDLDTVTRGRNIDKKLKRQSYQEKNNNKQIDDIKNLIGYQSVLMSIDERSEMIKKYHEFMRNQVGNGGESSNLTNVIINKQQNNSREKPNNNNNLSNKNIRMTKQLSQNSTKKLNTNNQKPLNQGEVFNQLKNKKQGKILNWAQGQAQQAQDLFSNCSTNKKSRIRASQLLKEINKEIHQKNKKEDNKITGIPQNAGVLSQQQQVNMKKKQRPLEVIQQKKIKSSIEKLRQRSYEKKISSISNQQQQNTEKKQQQQVPKNSFSRQKGTQITKSRPNRLNSAQQRNIQQPPQPPVRNSSRERGNKTATNSFKQSNNIENGNYQNSRNRNEHRRSLSKEKESTGWSSSKQINTNNFVGTGYSKGINKTSSEILSGRQAPPMPQNASQARKLPHLPPQQKPVPNIDAMTIATQQQIFEVQSFIKNQLLSLNKQQRQLQQQLKNIHIENKQKIKEVQKKYNIKTDYKHSHQLKDREDGEQVEEEIENDESLGSYQKMHKRQTEDELEESIQRLDDMLMRREIANREKQSRITEQDNESQSTRRSLINPMSDPISLHKQVLQLAQNLSRFEGEPQDITTGYGAKLRMKKVSRQQKSLSPKPTTPLKNMKKPTSSNQLKKQTQIDLSQSQDVNYSQLNGGDQRQSKVSSYRISKVSKPPSLQYENYNCNIPDGYGESGILDDQLEDSIEKGKIEVNEKLKKMLLD